MYINHSRVSSIAYKRWSRKKAIDFMSSHEADPIHTVEVEVDRYITWPGQSCAYKTGEMKIKQIREMAEKKLGRLFFFVSSCKSINNDRNHVYDAGAVQLGGLVHEAHNITWDHELSLSGCRGH